MALKENFYSIFHSGTKDFLSSTSPKLGDVIDVFLRVEAIAPIEQLVLRTIPNGEQQFAPMYKHELDGSLQIWRGTLKINEIITPYRFGIQTDQSVYWLNAAGVTLQEPFSIFDFKIIANFKYNPWLHNKVFYQIFPDRFANGDNSNDPTMENIEFRNLTRTTYDWGTFPESKQKNIIPFYGGDLKGIKDHLDYLLDLGVNGIYLNPIFKAFSNHRYDVTDYDCVDPVLGGDCALVDLKSSMQDHDMHLILDIVPNHCGFGHPWFQKARLDSNSEESGFFYFNKSPDDYEAWMGHMALPKLNYGSQKLRNLIYQNEDSVFRKWLREPFNADGWRVDVANMLGRRDQDQFGQEIITGIRQAVKTEKEDAYLIGENFYEASSQLQGSGWDGVMNYSGFCTPLWHWLCGYHQQSIGWQGELLSTELWPTEVLIHTWQDHLAAIPWQIALQQFNILDSHDTARIRTIVRENDALHRLATICQFTFPGVPCIYYGDEVGMLDQEGFDSRNCMTWEETLWNTDLLNFYKRIIRLRKNSDVLKFGSFQFMFYDENFFLYQREFNGRHIIVSANRSQTEYHLDRLDVKKFRIKDGETFFNFAGNKKIQVHGGKLSLLGISQGAEIWISKDDLSFRV